MSQQSNTCIQATSSPLASMSTSTNGNVSTSGHKESTSNASDDVISKILTSSHCSQRTIGYAILPGSSVANNNDGDNNKNHQNTAICYFYPLSGCSSGAQAYLKSSLSKFRCRFLVVDRPGIGATSDLLPPQSSPPQQQHHAQQQSDQREHFALHRIQGHVQDVRDVLQAEGIDHLYVYGVCIGHPYAVELCRQLLPVPEQQEQQHQTSSQVDTSEIGPPTLHGLTLVAPFVSTACPVSWKIARWGAAVPNFVMTSVVKGAMSVASTLMPHFVNPNMLKRLIAPEEQKEFGWTDDDFERLCQVSLEVKNESPKHAKTVEAQLGVASIWQFEICDKFATESGCGLVLQDDNAQTAGKASNNTSEQDTTKPPPLVPIRIHASPHDKLATPASVEWITRRCYGGGEKQDMITWHENIHSHESMTFFGGPPHNPSLLLQAAREWGLLTQESS